MKLTDFDTAVEVLVEAIRTNYRDFTDRGAIAKMHRENGNGELSNTNREMIKDFDKSLSVKRGSKYTKIIDISPMTSIA